MPSETILIDNKDPPWINKKTKGLIHEKNLVCKKSPQEKQFRHSKHFFSNSGLNSASYWELKIKIKWNLNEMGKNAVSLICTNWKRLQP